ncbi:hypothetical protein ACOMHN_030324 [Nucella lapillus]
MGMDKTGTNERELGAKGTGPHPVCHLENWGPKELDQILCVTYRTGAKGTGPDPVCHLENWGQRNWTTSCVSPRELGPKELDQILCVT